MPSYMSYMRQMSVLDEDGEIESWITVKGNHIPIRKGQSKEDAVKSFIEKKGGSKSKSESKKSEKKRETYTTAEGFEFYKDTNEPVKKGGYTLADKKGNIILQANFVDNTKPHNDKGLYQDALNELDDQIAEKEKELENIHSAMTENAEAGYFDIASANMEDIEFVKGQLNELKKKREKLAGSGKEDDPRPKNADAETINDVLFNKYVPKQGKADTLLGEQLRAINKIVYRYENDGDMYGNGYGVETVNAPVKFLQSLYEEKSIPHLSGIVSSLKNAAKTGDTLEYEHNIQRLKNLMVNADWETLKKLANTKNKEDMYSFEDDTRYDAEEEDW